MISNDAFKLLKWLKENDEWMDKKKIERECKYFSNRSFKAITEEKLAETRLSSGSSWTEHRISDHGKAYLEGARYARQTNIREWLSFGLSIAAIIISIIALLMQAGIL